MVLQGLRPHVAARPDRSVCISNYVRPLDGAADARRQWRGQPARIQCLGSEDISQVVREAWSSQSAQPAGYRPSFLVFGGEVAKPARRLQSLEADVFGLPAAFEAFTEEAPSALMLGSPTSVMRHATHFIRVLRCACK
jgi:hypothetical protein